MNRLLTALLVASLGLPVFSSSAAASPGFAEETWVVARKGGDTERPNERSWRKSKPSSDNRKQEAAEDEGKEGRGYGYGYERRGFDRPERVYDDRGRR